MKINWNKIVGGALLVNSIVGNTGSSTTVKAEPYGLEKTFEVNENLGYYNNFVETQTQKLGELNLVDQIFADIYSVGKLITCPTPCQQVCWDGLHYATDMCMASIFPPACVAAAGVAFGLCMTACAALEA